MGCDIHATLEYDKYYKKQIERGDERPYRSWYHFAKDIDIDRGYYFFTLIAGVRDMDLRPIISPPRGAPDDASYGFKQELESWDSNAHSTSWVSFTELRDWKATNAKKLKLEYDPEKDMKEQDFYKTMEMLAGKYGTENVRLCFFFDN